MNKRPWWARRSGERRMNCMQVARVLQKYLDGETDEITARRVAVHLEDCRRCGLEASVYQEIRGALARRAEPDADALARLTAFGRSLVHDGQVQAGDAPDSASPPAGA
ncbi:anti-sigma factor family protein [Streptomyces sp. KMM 9044]|uniref:anti-sigma factor family protein n=1 Tax=Streptomyces sp. KMM 9044 TaxID=2744474 RepID=UPI002151EC56|nr:zf-HC2 domain-containing protein [Streptomyces sp. KMM 9044]WAX77481.1 zf-HC2 domain-containing protein [Streptomyces sp. KMM 9044]